MSMRECLGKVQRGKGGGVKEKQGGTVQGGKRGAARALVSTTNLQTANRGGTKGDVDLVGRCKRSYRSLMCGFRCYCPL